MILLPNKHNGNSLSSQRRAQILESNCLKRCELIEQRAEILIVFVRTCKTVAVLLLMHATRVQVLCYFLIPP